MPVQLLSQAERKRLNRFPQEIAFNGEQLQQAVDESEEFMRPPENPYFDFLEARYTYLRQFTPGFLDTLTFHSNQPLRPVLF